MPEASASRHCEVVFHAMAPILLHTAASQRLHSSICQRLTLGRSRFFPLTAIGGSGVLPRPSANSGASHVRCAKSHTSEPHSAVNAETGCHRRSLMRGTG